jgi:hypothetical protein
MRQVACMEMRYAQKILIGKSEGKKSSWRTRRREDDILKWIFKQYVDWIKMAHNWVQWRAAMNIAVNFRILYTVRALLTSWATIIFPRMALILGIT